MVTQEAVNKFLDAANEMIRSSYAKSGAPFTPELSCVVIAGQKYARNNC